MSDFQIASTNCEDSSISLDNSEEKRRTCRVSTVKQRYPHQHHYFTRLSARLSSSYLESEKDGSNFNSFKSFSSASLPADLSLFQLDSRLTKSCFALNLVERLARNSTYTMDYEQICGRRNRSNPGKYLKYIFPLTLILIIIWYVNGRIEESRGSLQGFHTDLRDVQSQVSVIKDSYEKDTKQKLSGIEKVTENKLDTIEKLLREIKQNQMNANQMSGGSSSGGGAGGARAGSGGGRADSGAVGDRLSEDNNDGTTGAAGGINSAAGETTATGTGRRASSCSVGGAAGSNSDGRCSDGGGSSTDRNAVGGGAGGRSGGNGGGFSSAGNSRPQDSPLHNIDKSDPIYQLIQQALEEYSADKTGKVDYALESAGGSIINSGDTEPYTPAGTGVSLFGIPLCSSMHGPRALIQASSLPGECWAFKGSKGNVVIRLIGRVVIQCISVEHISKISSPSGEIDSAPKEFSIWGLSDPNNIGNGKNLGQFTYDIKGSPIQYFLVGADKPYEFIEFKVHSNHGNPVYTCVYRLRVHGRLE